MINRDNIHPLAYWLWALGLIVAAAQLASITATALLVLCCASVVMRWRTSSPWASAFEKGLILAAIVLAIRLIVGLILTVPASGQVLFTLPRIQLPHWMAGIGIGGAVTRERIMSALSEGAVIAGLIAITGAAVSLSQPRKLLRQVPAALHEAGVVIVIASTFVPQLIASVQRVRQARRLRGRSGSTWRGTAIPVLEDALEKATSLAMAMESRGYGRVQTLTPGKVRSTQLLMLGGLAALVVGVFGLLTVGDQFSLVLVLIGSVAAAVALQQVGERTLRTNFRPASWNATSFAFVITGALTALVGFVDPLPGHTALLVAAIPAVLHD